MFNTKESRFNHITSLIHKGEEPGNSTSSSSSQKDHLTDPNLLESLSELDGIDYFKQMNQFKAPGLRKERANLGKRSREDQSESESDSVEDEPDFDDSVNMNSPTESITGIGSNNLGGVDDMAESVEKVGDLHSCLAESLSSLSLVPNSLRSRNR